MYKSIFTNDGLSAHIGYTDGKTETPYFEFIEALQVMHEHNKYIDETFIEYDEAHDQFYKMSNDTSEPDIWKGRYYSTDDGLKRLYRIGFHPFLWSEITDYDIERIAGEIVSFIWDYDDCYGYDTYKDRDPYVCQEELTDSIIPQLKEFTILKKVLGIFENDNLTEKFKFNKLKEILNI